MSEQFSKYFICILSDMMIFFLSSKTADQYGEDSGYTVVGVAPRAAIQYCFSDRSKSKRIIKE